MSIRKKNRYTGMRSGSRPTKYADCEYVSVCKNNKVRLLTPVEVDEFRAHIQRLIDPSLRTRPVMRRSIV